MKRVSVWLFHINIWERNNNGWYSRKWNKFSPGISLTLQAWFCFASYFCRWKLNIVRRSSYRQRRVYFTIIYFPRYHELKTWRKNKQFKSKQTYSWNKGGLKLFCFQEYRPCVLLVVESLYYAVEGVCLCDKYV